MKKNRIFFGTFVIIFAAANFMFSFKEYKITSDLKLIANQAIAQAEGGGGEYSWCIECWNPYPPQKTYQIVCYPYGYPGCWYQPCGYHYICD